MASSLERARAAFARQAWGEARDAFAGAAREGPLGADDHEQFAVAAYLIGADEPCEKAWDVAQATSAPGGSAIEWHVGDATSLPFEDDTYDAVLCQMGIMFMADRAAAVSEMCRVLAPGGRVVVNTPGAIQPPFIVLEQAIVEHISADLGGFVRAVFSMHDPNAVATLLCDAGLRDVTAHVSPVALRASPKAWRHRL